MKTVRLVPKYRGRRYECFDCRLEVIAPFTLAKCPNCESKTEFHLMH